MGVHGLWKLVEPSGKIVPLDTLENKVLAVDVSIWLHQALKGFQDAHGNAVRNAHLLGLFHRICKLLFYNIKPVFVFDGGIPHLKKQTMAARRQQKSRAEQKSEQAREKLLKNIIRHKALRKVLGQHAGEMDIADAQSQQTVDMFHLLPMQEQTLGEGSGNEQHDDEDDDGDDDALEEILHGQHYKDLHSINVNSAEFKALPANKRHDILSELKETRKQSSWGRLHEIPKESGDFSSYQMARLLKRRSVQVSLEEAEKEMGGRTLSLGELEELLCDQGVDLTPDIGRRIASDNITRYLYINESQDSELKRNSQVDSSSEVSELCSSPEKPGPSKSVAQLQVKGTEPAELKKLDSLTSYNTENVILQSDIISSEEDQDDNLGVSSHDPLLQVARDFMLENSSLTQEQILSVIKNQDIPDKSAEAKPETTSLILQSENLIDKKKIDSENLGVTQKEILAMIQAELVRCKDLLEADSKGQLGEGTSTTEDDGMISFSKNETLKPGFSCLSAVAEINTNVKITGDLQITTVNATQDLITTVNDTQDLQTVTALCTTQDMQTLTTVDTTQDLETITSDNTTQDLQTITAVSTSQDLQAVANVNTTGDMQTITTVNTTKGVQTDVCFSPEEHISSCTEGGDNSLKNGHIEMVVKTNIPAEDVSSDDDTDNDFIEVTEEQVNHSVLSQKDVCKQNSSIGPVLKTEVTADDDIFADVFSSADTKKLDKIVGKLKKTYQVASKTFDVGSCVSNAAIEETVTSNKISLEKSFENDLQSRSIEKMCDLTDFSVEEGIENKQGQVAVSTERVKNIPGTENENPNEEEVPVHKPVEKLNLQELQALQVNLEKEQMSLLSEKGKQERLAASITDQMYIEAQELLQLFGIPYIVAPMEAEAQCAFLDIVSLTDGTITDDSDIWLFGGQRVYKNFFNHKKQVLRYQATDIQHYFKLNRQQLILLALLVGSDYTVGLQGVGPVTALEILGVFSSKQQDQDIPGLLHGLNMFRDWLRSGIGMGPGKGALRSKLKNVHIHEGFPSMPVVDAYLHPQVDESKEAFSWGTPDLLSLQNYARQKFSWTSKKTDEILLPVLKRLSESKSQKSIDSYYKVERVLLAADAKMSKRVQQAVQRIGGESVNDCEEPRPKKQRRAKNQQVHLKKQNTQNVAGVLHDGTHIVENNITSRSCDGENSDLPGTSGSNASPSKEFIPQREQDKVNSLKNKMKAIEVFRKSKYGLDRTKRDRRFKRQILKEAYLSESSSESS